MDFLKGGYRFYTEFYTDEDDNLLIKGYGDPYLVSEEISIIARKLTALGLQFVYINFNRRVLIQRGAAHLPKSIRAGLFRGPQTPLTATAIKLGQTLSPGTLERFNTGKDKLIHESYVVELFSEVFARNGIRITGTSEAKPGRSKLKLILTHENTRTLRDVAKGLMEYSNNFIANQVMTVIGGEYNGYPTDLQTGLRVFRRINQEIFPDLEGQYAFYEGSGLSRDNRVTCNYMMRVLYAYRNYYETMPFRSGAYVKTGTLTGINNIAGYIPHEGRLYPFVMILYTNDDERFRFVGIMKNLLLL
ncbi:hypothetical protein CHS0354_018521 [Potamilus streckersoni]|uniref:Serine-type D-Ala-D-Ala carboxypeptidase n=1 Tax=Potamilus streckersoni TaxID=2493646 RepID=A0AAE0TBR4_9BIVA|nr:hypothetical protein CHS0354_018521 [Potamilus streckersoni]